MHSLSDPEATFIANTYGEPLAARWVKKMQREKHSCIDSPIPLDPVTMLNAILHMVLERGAVTFAEIATLPGARGGNRIALENKPTIWLWDGLSPVAISAVISLLADKQIRWALADIALYCIDGEVLNLPVVTIGCDLSKPHWLPVELRPHEG
jgi:hypothetical protein